MSAIFEFGSNILVGLVDLINVLVSTFINGIQFFISSMSTIPGFIIDIISGLPSFFKVGLSGVFGLLLLVVFFKIVAIIRTS